MIESKKWYDSKAERLGLEFLLEVKHAESLTVQYPECWPIYEAETRRYIMKNFLFLLFI
ncbi:MAG TPA: hypothetical protein VJL89_02620 [Thermodesulfovibrionia bacterium]|nr:hypothetical protein [Thermodesulfovibrionia bacterium]